jgi:hypothetical protein
VGFHSEARILTSNPDIKWVQVVVTRSDQAAPVYFHDFREADGTLTPGFFPATLAIVPKDGDSLGVPFTVAVRAYATDNDESKLLVNRTSTSTFVTGRSLYMPMPLRMACALKSCDEGQTCVGGECRDDRIDAESLPDYVAENVLPERAGTACFDELACLNKSVSVPVEKDCTFKVPTGNANVSIRWAAADKRIIALDGDDADEGWSRVDGTTGKLSSGVCKALQEQSGSTGEIPDKALEALISSECPTKVRLQTFCRIPNEANVGVGRDG